MLSVTARFVLFASSYAPLLVLFAVLDSFGPGWPSVLCASLALASVLALGGVWWVSGHTGPADWLRLSSARSRDTEVMAFFVSYVVPFAAVGDSDRRTRIALAVFAVVLAGLYVRSAVFYAHPILLLAGYHVVEAVTDSDVPVTVITRRRHVRQDARLWVRPVSTSVFLEQARR